MAEASLLLLQNPGTESVSNGLTNGVTNGTSESSRHKDKDRDRHKSSHRDKDRHSSSHRSSSSSGHKSSSHKSSSSDKDREKDKHKSSSDKDRDKDRHKSSSSSSGDKEKLRDKDKDKDRHKSSSSSSDKNKHRSSIDKDKERSKDKEKSDKDKHRSSSSSKDKHSSSNSSGDKHRSSSDKDKKHSSSSSSSRDKDKDKDRDRHHSSSKSSHKDRHRDKDKDRHCDKDRHRDDKKKEEKEPTAMAVQQEEVEELTSPAPEPTHNNVENSTTETTSQDSCDDTTMNEHNIIDGSVESTHVTNLLDRTADTSQDGSQDMRGEASAESEEEDKLVINVKDEPNDSAQQEEYEYEMALQKVEKEEPHEREEDDEVPLSFRKKVKNEESDEDYQEDGEASGGDDDVPLAARTKEIIKGEESDGDDKPLSARKRTKAEPQDEESDDDVPLVARKKPKEEAGESDDDIPLAARRKPDKKQKKKRKKPGTDDEEDDDFKPKAKKAKVKKEKKEKANKRGSTGEVKSPTKRVKKESEEEKNVWKWWEEEKNTDGRKWSSLEHKGVVFADPYVRLPPNILLRYNGDLMPLSKDSEEVAGFYAKMLEHDYVTKEQFNKNFFKDWRKVMTAQEREKITDLTKCNFVKMHAYFVEKNEERKNRSKEEKKELKEKNEELIREYGWCIIDGHKQKVANFRAEPPGLFRGRGDHPRMGALKNRITPEDVLINCSKDSVIPKAPEGHRWKEIRSDNTVTWLASWSENVQGQTKYVMLNASSKLKGEKDWQKYEMARRLHHVVNDIREQYTKDWKSKEMRIRQRAVALYFIDKLALRAGNEKDEDQADTVGCCSLRVEHITLHETKEDKECVVAFDFLGKDSIRYYNEVPVEKRVFKNLCLFMENKAPGDDLFDRLNTQIMNKHLTELMDGLTAKVFRTYNASRTLQDQLNKLTDADDDMPEKVLSYNRANREVAILCNHQRAVPKTYDQSMLNLQKKIDDKKDLIIDAEKDLKTLKRQAKTGGSIAEKTMYEKKKKHLERLNDQLHKLEISSTDKQENKQIALGTSKLNYLDPRISVAWCKKYDVPIEKVYNKTQRLKFQWAIEMTTEDYDFTEKPKPMIRTHNDTNNGEDQEDQEDQEYDD